MVSPLVGLEALIDDSFKFNHANNEQGYLARIYTIRNGLSILLANLVLAWE